MDAPDQQGHGQAGFLLERNDDASKSEQAFEEVARIDAAVVIFASDLLAGLGRALLDVHVVRRDRDVIEKPAQPGDADCEQADQGDQEIAGAADGEAEMPEDLQEAAHPADQIEPQE